MYLTLVPKPSYSARRLSVLIFFDNGKEIERMVVSKNNNGDYYKGVWTKEQKDQWQAIAQVISEKNPNKIALNYSNDWAFGDGISSTLKEKFVNSIDKKFASRIVSGENLCIGWLETRIPEEMEVYGQIVSIAHQIIAEAYSSKVITPGITTSDDVSWWIREKTNKLGLGLWFPSGVEIIRPKSSPYKNSNIIHRGDVLHCDIGTIYLGLNTDTQQLAYILKEEEQDAPIGLKKGLAEANRLQDILLEEMIVGKTGNEILKASLEKAKSFGMKPSIYTHPLGLHGHGAGPVIGLYDSQEGVAVRGDYKLYPNTCHSIELNTRCTVPEWNNEEVAFSLEQDAFFNGEKTIYLDKKQTKFYLVK